MPNRLEGLLTAGQRLDDPADLVPYETDAGLERALPAGVVFPRTVADVQRIVAWANRTGVPLVARGAGTGTSGGAVAERSGLIVEFSRMSRVLEFDALENRIAAEPGVANYDLDQFARARGLIFPPDPASGRVCTIGGNVAENAGGPRCFKYGVTTNYVAGLKVVLADGRVVRLGGRALDYPEYDWTGILTGSEGTLGLVAEVQVRVLRQPPAATLLMAAFDSIEQAGDAVSHMLAQGLVPATIEMMDQAIVRIVEDYAHIGLPVDAGAIIIVEVNGYAASLPAQVNEITTVLAEHHPCEVTLAENAEQQTRITRARKDSAGALARIAPAYYASDVTVPRSKIAVTLREISRICAAYNVPVNFLLHAGDGNLHPNYMVADAADPELMERVRNVEAEVLAFCVRQGGSITGEHGVGIERRDLMPLMYNADELQIMQDIKRVFDPRELLNPGKIFPAEPPVPVPALRPGKYPPADYAPSSAEQAGEAIRACLSSQRPASIRLRGHGTKSCRLPPTAVVLSTRNLRGIRACVPEDSYVTAGAGTPLAEIQQELARYKRWIPLVSPWDESTVGGILSSNLNGPLRMRYSYGGMRDLVLAVTVALPDGHVARFGRPVVKNVAGYDMPKLFVGARGTLGMLAEVTLKTVTLPRARASVVVPCDKVAQGLEWGKRLKSVCLGASALLLCRGCAVAELNAPFALVYTAEGIPQDVAAELQEVHQALRQAGAPQAVTLDQFSGSDLWAGWMRSTGPDDALIQVGVGARSLGQLLSLIPAAFGDHACMADLGNGMLYVQGREDEELLTQLRGRALAAGGYAIVLCAPEGSRLERWGYQPDALPEMRALKARWDPQGVFNPGAFIL